MCRLVKSLYGLKQAPKCWADTLAEVLILHGFRACHFDPALYVKKHANGEWSYVNTYVDDFLVGVRELFVYDALVAAMKASGWEVKEMGLPTQFLSLDMAISVDQEGRCTQIILSQHSAITDLVERFPQTLSTRKTQTPMVSGDIVGYHVDSTLMPNNLQFASLIGSFIYFATCTRADSAHAVSVLSRFCAAPTQAQWAAAKRLLQYLRDHK